MLEELRAEFLQEAQHAPKLFRDLAKVEQYIAESYKTRALIELMQNADDAESTALGVHDFEGGFIVGNNGRPFTPEDVESLCRSGSSNKNRGGNTIGYRGIGFKSVVNLAKRIWIFSGEFAFYFDKAKTQQELGTSIDVPLIRVPHLWNQEEAASFASEVKKLKAERGYQTVFVFCDLNERLSTEEISEFDRSSLLFLNNLRKVSFDFGGIKREIRSRVSEQEGQHVVTVTEGDESDEWEVLYSRRDRVNRIGLKRLHGEIIPALPEESVVHSFTPTIEFSGAYLKINGNYSTDPSRKSVDMDEFSEASLGDAVEVITDLIVATLNGEVQKRGVFTPFTNVTTHESSRFKPKLLNSIREKLEERQVSNSTGEMVAFSAFRLKPKWLNYEDYEELCGGGTLAVKKEILLLNPEVFAFLECMHIRRLSLEEVMERIASNGISSIGCAEVFASIVNQYRYELDNTRLDRIKRLRIFPVGDTFLTAEQVKDSTRLNPEFYDHVSTHSELSDIRMFFRKLGIEIGSRNVGVEGGQRKGAELGASTRGQVQSSQGLFRGTPAIKNWRSAEKNAVEYLRALQCVLSVADVSQANLGYDLEVMLANKKRIFIEVKSVTSFLEAFKLSNNEYSSAHHYGHDYFLALVINNEDFEIRIISNPLEALGFERKIERVAWFCEDYHDVLQDINLTLAERAGGASQ